ncbi:hydroxyethylthiazole kinase [Theileria orientalis]|uniref:Hydroxyethylthiazole kinase n=1 Tax=Theileria orientalis TaxID=68886 RepID=A0A976MAR4_THEOR|nr:hydroxyethylthiazole kinase [Theileria orientalis]
MIKLCNIINKSVDFNLRQLILNSKRICTISSTKQFTHLPLKFKNKDYYDHRGIYPLIGDVKYNFKCYSSTRDEDVTAIIESGREFYEIQQEVNLSDFTSNYWRTLRVSKPLLLTFNVDKSSESRMMDSVMGSGVHCKNMSSLDELFETILQYKEHKDLIGCYFNLDNNYDAYLTINKDLFDKIRLSSNSVFLDVTYPYNQSVDEYMKISKIINLVSPHVLRFCNGTLKFLLNTDLHCPLLKENGTNEDFSMERCYYISEKYNLTVIDSSENIVVSNHNNMEVVVFPRLPQILNKIHGHNNCFGAVIASMITLSSDNYLVPSSAAISGLDFVSSESAKKANGPGSMLHNMLDSIYNLSMSPDVISEHKTEVKFYKRK